MAADTPLALAMADQIQFTADGSQAFDVIARLQSQLGNLENRFNNSGRGGADHIGDGMLRSERRVTRSASNIASSLLSLNNPLEAIAGSFLQLEYATKLGLFAGIGVGVAIAAFEVVAKAITAVHEARLKLFQDLRTPLALDIQLGPKDIEARIQQIDKDITDLRKKSGSIAFQAIQGVEGGFNAPARRVGSTRADSIAFEDEGKVQAAATARAKAEEETSNLILSAMSRKASLEAAYGAALIQTANLKTIEAREGKNAAEHARAQLEYTQETAKILSEFSKPGADQAAIFGQFSAAKITRDQKIDKLDEEDLIKQEEDRAASEIANFQGTKQETEDFTTKRSKEKLQAEIDILHAYQDQEAEQKKQLDLDELSGKAAEKKADEAKKAADEKFKNDQEVGKAKTDNQVALLQSQGLGFEANILKIREQTEEKIAKHLREQRSDLAQQDKIAGALATKEAFKKALQNPQGIQHAEDVAKQEEAEFQRKIQYYKDQIGRGVKFDANDPTAKLIKQYLDGGKPPGTQDGGKDGDFSSVASLAGRDFSSLAALGEADFSGLAALANLQLTVAK